jgi:hypothetical protein
MSCWDRVLLAGLYSIAESEGMSIGMKKGLLVKEKEQ